MIRLFVASALGIAAIVSSVAPSQANLVYSPLVKPKVMQTPSFSPACKWVAINGYQIKNTCTGQIMPLPM